MAGKGPHCRLITESVLNEKKERYVVWEMLAITVTAMSARLITNIDFGESDNDKEHMVVNMVAEIIINVMGIIESSHI